MLQNFLHEDTCKYCTKTILSRNQQKRLQPSHHLCRHRCVTYHRTITPGDNLNHGTIHTKQKVVNELSKLLSPKQLYGCHPKSCQSCQRWQPKSCYQDNPILVLKGFIYSCHVTILTPLRLSVLLLWPFWQLMLSKIVFVTTFQLWHCHHLKYLKLWVWQLRQLWQPKSCHVDNLLTTLTTFGDNLGCHNDNTGCH